MWEELIGYSKNLNGGGRPMAVSRKRELTNAEIYVTSI